MKSTILFIFLFLTLSLSALAKSMQFRHYDVEAGMPSNCVRGITQDQHGFMWFATDGGLVRFDGYQFRSYPLGGSRGNTIEENFIRYVHSVDSTLWVGTDIALYRYDAVCDTFTDFELRTSRNRLTASPVLYITNDAAGSVWVSVEDEGLFQISATDNLVTHYDFPQCSNYLTNIFVEHDNNIWVQSTHGPENLFRLDRTINTFKAVSVNIEGEVTSVPSRTIAQDSDGNLWIGLWDGRIVRFDTLSGRGLFVNDREGILPVVHIHSMTFLPGSRLMIGSDEGLTELDTNTLHAVNYVYDELNEGSLSDRFVYPIYRDREGGLWVGTFYGGVNYLPPDVRKFEQFRYSAYRNSVGGTLVSSFCEDTNGNIWIVSNDGGLSCYNPSNGTFRRIPVRLPDGTEMVNLHTVCIDGDDLWLGSYAMGVARYNIRTGEIHHYSADPEDPTKLDSSSSYAIFRDSHNEIWVATFTGIHLFQRDTDSFLRVRSIGATTSCITQDKSGKLWFSTYGKGLFSYMPRSGVWKNYRYSDTSGALPHNHVNCVYQDSRGSLWIGSTKGLRLYDAENDVFDTCDNLPVNLNVMSIVEEQGVLWLGTDNGLYRYRPGGDYRVYHTSDGLLANQFMAPACLKASDGRIYMGTDAGFCAFYPHQIRPNNYQAPICFTGLEIGGYPVNAGSRNLPTALNSTGEIHLYEDDRNVTIYFSALSFDNPEQSSYSYRLEGFDRDWINAGNNNKATYTNLPPGNYRLTVRSVNNDKVHGREASLKIKVLPPWYNTILMKLLYMALVLGGLFFFMRYLVRRADKKHAVEIERLKSAREKEVFQAKLNFFTVIAHEIRTPVSLIIAPLEKIMRTKESMTPALRDDLSIIARNGQRLLFLVNQLLDFKKVEQSDGVMKFRPSDINALITGVADRFRPSIEQKGGTLEVSLPQEKLVADVDAEAVTKLVSNLLNNARKFMRNKVSISLNSDETKGTFSIVVTDNGEGISAENREKIFAPFFQVSDVSGQGREGTGLGLSIVRSMASNHKGTVTVDSEVGKYTTFTATLPLHQDEIWAPEEEEEPAETPTTHTEPKTESRSTILLVDDNDEMLSFLAASFCKDYEVLTAVDGVDALKVLGEHTVDFIVSDWMMPRMDGVEFCRKVRNDPNTSHIPFILLTAKTDNYSKIQGMKGGADIYIEKPFSLEYMRTCIDNIGEMRERLRRKFSESPLTPITTVAQTPVDNEFLEKLEQLVEANFTNPDLNVDFLANELKISRSTLYAKIRSLTDMTPNELIQLTRLKRAAVLLTEGKHRINEIGYMVGFNSSSYFSKCFKAQFGMKPGDFTGHQQP